MRTIWAGAAILAALAGVTVATPASATPTDAIGCTSGASPCTISLSTFIGSGTPGVSSPYGSVTLTDIGGGGVSVSVSLDTNVYFAETGAGLPLLWDWSGTALTSSNVTSIVFTGPGPITTGGILDVAPGHEDGSGSWQYGVDCAGSCGNGGSPPHYDGITFNIGVGNIDSFALNDDLNNFATDLCLGINPTSGSCSATGDVIGGGSKNNPVPEPLTLWLFGAGLAGLAAVRRRKAKA
jgi:hypothetical protein